MLDLSLLPLEELMNVRVSVASLFEEGDLSVESTVEKILENDRIA